MKPDMEAHPTLNSPVETEAPRVIGQLEPQREALASRTKNKNS